MTLKEFISRPGLLDRFITYFGILKNRNIVIPINHEPDYDLMNYKRGEDKDYYFRNKYSFLYEFDTILSAEVSHPQVHSESVLWEIGRSLDIYYNPDKAAQFFDQVMARDKDILSEHSFDIQMDQFRLHQFRVQSIDNTNKDVVYEGSFYGDHETDSDLRLFATIELEGIPWTIHFDAFYKSLLAESYALYKEEKYRLSFFAAYAAFESYINAESTSEKEEERLSEKISEVFNARFPDLGDNQVYAAFMNYYKGIRETRNAIAHGTPYDPITRTTNETALLFTSSMILCHQNSIRTLSELAKAIS